MTGPDPVLAAAGRRGAGLVRRVSAVMWAGTPPTQQPVAMEAQRSGWSERFCRVGSQD